MSSNQNDHGSAGRILRHSWQLLSSSLLGRGVGTVVSFVVADVLGPRDFGVLKVVSLVPTLSKYGSLGFDAVLQREIPHLRSRREGREVEAKVRGVGVTADLGWMVLVVAMVVVIALTMEQSIYRFGLLVAAVGLAAQQVNRLFLASAAIDRDFTRMSLAQGLAALAQAGVTLLLLWEFRVLGVLWGLVAGSLTSVIVLRLLGVRLNCRPTFDTDELRRQVRIALPLLGGTVAYGLFAWVERFEVLGLLGEERLGVYMLSVSLFELTYLVTQSALRAASIDLYEALGRALHSPEAKRLLLGPTYLFAYLMPAAGGLAWIGGYPLVRWLLPDYIAVQEILPFLAAMLTLRAVTAMPITAMNSGALNLQHVAASLWLVAVVGFGGVTWLGDRIGLGLAAPALGKTLGLLAMALSTFLYLLRCDVFEGPEVLRLTAALTILLPGTWVVGLLITEQSWWAASPWGALTGSLAFASGFSLLALVCEAFTGCLRSLRAHAGGRL